MKMDVGAWPRCGGRCAGGGSPGVLPEGLATLHAAAGKAILHAPQLVFPPK